MANGAMERSPLRTLALRYYYGELDFSAYREQRARLLDQPMGRAEESAMTIPFARSGHAPQVASGAGPPAAHSWRFWIGVLVAGGLALGAGFAAYWLL